jgi:hypothetical protein
MQVGSCELSPWNARKSFMQVVESSIGLALKQAAVSLFLLYETSARPSPALDLRE